MKFLFLKLGSLVAFLLSLHELYNFDVRIFSAAVFFILFILLNTLYYKIIEQEARTELFDKLLKNATKLEDKDDK